MRRRACWRALAATVAAAAALATTGAAAQGQMTHHHLAARTRPDSLSSQLAAILHPQKKYYGVYVSRAPKVMAPVRRIANETGKRPNLSLYYEDWGSAALAGRSNVDLTAAEHACHAGMLPMLTWESWNTADTGRRGVAMTQREFSPAKIAHGRFDRYIRASARAIKTLHCPIALRLDQEVNSNWYPWAVATPGMHNTPHDYVAMWRHVWGIFKAVHADNVVWVWTPNAQTRSHPGLPALRKSYPGNRYVDWVGVDGYFYHRPHQTFHGLFGATIAAFKRFASTKPWIIAECGVGSGPSKPRQIRDLLAAVARSSRFDGINYFDTNKAWNRSDWTLDQTAASLRAFRSGINRPAFGAAKPGTVAGT